MNTQCHCHPSMDDNFSLNTEYSCLSDRWSSIYQVARVLLSGPDRREKQMFCTNKNDCPMSFFLTGFSPTRTPDVFGDSDEPVSAPFSRIIEVPTAVTKYSNIPTEIVRSGRESSCPTFFSVRPALSTLATWYMYSVNCFDAKSLYSGSTSKIY
jgi:hypothetical protein